MRGGDAPAASHSGGAWGLGMLRTPCEKDVTVKVVIFERLGPAVHDILRNQRVLAAIVEQHLKEALRKHFAALGCRSPVLLEDANSLKGVVVVATTGGLFSSTSVEVVLFSTGTNPLSSLFPGLKHTYDELRAHIVT
jgi:hypothetical protein